MKKIFVFLCLSSIFLYGCGKSREQINAEQEVENLEYENSELQDKISELEKELEVEKQKNNQNTRASSNPFGYLNQEPQEDQIYGDNGVVYNKSGDGGYYYGSDGKSYQKIGNALRSSDGTYCYKLGNTYNCSR